MKKIEKEDLSNEQIQVILSGILGDGSIAKTGRAHYNSSHKEYMKFKKELLDDICNTEVRESMNKGYKLAPIFNISTLSLEYIKKLVGNPIESFINDLDELGIALWIFDDGSRHKKNNFYNICTHSIPREIEEQVLIPFLNKFNVFPTILKEVKKDGKEFTYLYVSKYQGAMELSKMMRKLDIPCYSYKLMPLELENAYFEVKDTEEWKELKTAHQRTAFIKNYLGMTCHQTIEHTLVSDTMRK